ncbi:uncharacterized protein LOC124138338 [Haliotis rufescens]|uniref:uncharacterized protein LOC124138338 n=1 Tax=Haliotis rufescens TaxID=6454 RepID=UPI00201EF016|nr:uncharacterized protein LOC124138338 [Haliotis rufescens]
MDPKRGSDMFIWLQNITCTGNEESLEFCAHSGWGEESCATFTGLVCTEARMILSSPAEEILEVAYNSTWGGVCADTFDDMAAKVACRMTGQPIEHARVGTPQRDVDIVLRVQSCLGNENSLGQCKHDGWGRNGNCKTGASVRCSFAAETHLEPSKEILDVHLGDQLDIKCVVDNAHPRVENFTWYFKEMEVGNGDTFTLSAQRGDQGELKCVADNGLRPIARASSILVNILYPPDVSCQGEHTVTEGDRVFINCSADSNPQPLNLTWTKATESFQADVDGGMVLLSLDNVDLDATGTYVLTVINAMVDYRGVARYGSSSTSVYIAVKAFPSRMFMNATIVVSFVAVVLASALVVTIERLARRGVHKPTSRYEATTERSVHFQSSPNVYIEEQGTSGAGNCQADGEEYFSQLDYQTRDIDASRYETTPERSVHFQSSPNVYIEEQGTSGAGNCQADGEEYYSEVDYQTRDLGEENIYENTMTK